jgi:hypothetical protein
MPQQGKVDFSSGQYSGTQAYLDVIIRANTDAFEEVLNMGGLTVEEIIKMYSGQSEK